MIEFWIVLIVALVVAYYAPETLAGVGGFFLSLVVAPLLLLLLGVRLTWLLLRGCGRLGHRGWTKIVS